MTSSAASPTAPSRVSWKPAGRSLADNVPQLLDQLAGDQFEVYRVMYNPADWDDTPRRVTVGDRVVKLGWFHSQDAATVTVIDGSGRGRKDVDLDTGTSAK